MTPAKRETPESTESELLAELLKLDPRGERHWSRKLSLEVQDELRKVRAAYRAGQLKHLTLHQICLVCRERLQLAIGVTTLRRYLTEDTHV